MRNPVVYDYLELKSLDRLYSAEITMVQVSRGLIGL